MAGISGLDMPPSSAGSNVADLMSADAVERRDVFALTNGCSNSQNVRCRQLGHPVRFAANVPASNTTFRRGIRHIGGSVAKPEMPRIDTGRNIATVQHPQATWYRPEVHFIRKPMRRNGLVIQFQASVTEISRLPCPEPACFCLVHIRPESYFQRSVALPAPADLRAKPLWKTASRAAAEMVSANVACPHGHAQFYLDGVDQWQA